MTSMDRTKFNVSFDVIGTPSSFHREIYLSQIEKVYLNIFLQDLEDEGRIEHTGINRVNDDEITMDALMLDVAATLGLPNIEGIGMKRREKTRTVRV